MQGLLPPSDERYVGPIGRLAAMDGDVLTIVDGEGDHLVVADDATILSRPSGHQWATDRDLSRLRIGDSVAVAGHRQPDGSLLAVVLSANAFVTHDGIITSRAQDYMDVRLRLDRLSTEYAEDSTRVWFAPGLNVEQLRPLGGKEPRSVGDLQVGTWVSFQGFFADNGDWVALYVYVTDRSGP